MDANGKVTGVKAGTATITAASEADAAKTAELKVTVTEVKADDAYGYVMVHFIENNKATPKRSTSTSHAVMTPPSGTRSTAASRFL